jgi:hypothetical protein
MRHNITMKKLQIISGIFIILFVLTSCSITKLYTLSDINWVRLDRRSTIKYADEHRDDYGGYYISIQPLFINVNTLSFLDIGIRRWAGGHSNASPIKKIIIDDLKIIFNDITYERRDIITDISITDINGKETGINDLGLFYDSGIIPPIPGKSFYACEIKGKNPGIEYWKIKYLTFIYNFKIETEDGNIYEIKGECNGKRKYHLYLITR